MLTDTQWLGLLLRSESDLPHEWIPLAWVVRNRVEAGRFPGSYPEVILQPMQFSYFNAWTMQGMGQDQVYGQARMGYAGESSGWPDNDLERAEDCASRVLSSPRWLCPFTQLVYYFWAPAGMGNTHPSWSRNMRRFQLPGLDRWFFAYE
jgi:hypothetical protein